MTKNPWDLHSSDVRVLLTKCLQELDVPSERRDISNDNNLRWLIRNLLINNSNSNARSAIFACQWLLAHPQEDEEHES